VIPLMELLREMHKYIPSLYTNTPDFKCKVWEDNQSCITMAESNRFSPRTKHIALKYHDFKSHVDEGKISISYINMHEQLADILTKPLDDKTFFVLRMMLNGY
jgi:hypothetical protein